MQKHYHIWICLLHPSSLYLKGSLGSRMTSIKTEATNGLVINQFNISNSMQIILKMVAVTVVVTVRGDIYRSADSNFLHTHYGQWSCFFILCIYLQMNPKSVCDVKLQFNTLVGKISLIVLERFSFTLNSSMAKLWMFLW